MAKRKKNNLVCLVAECGKEVFPENETDIGVGLVYSQGTPICIECFESEDPERKEEVERIMKDHELPF